MTDLYAFNGQFFNPEILGLDAANPGITGLENSAGIPGLQSLNTNVLVHLVNVHYSTIIAVVYIRCLLRLLFVIDCCRF